MACNNYLHNIVAFDFEIRDNIKVKNKGVIIKKGLNVADGISASDVAEWIAVSNHYTGTISIYRNSVLLNRFTLAVGTLTCIAYPHGLRLSHDGTKLFSTDARSQYLYVYESKDGGWTGEGASLKSLMLLITIAC